MNCDGLSRAGIPADSIKKFCRRKNLPKAATLVLAGIQRVACFCFEGEDRWRVLG
jgi:hypothetical protein